MVNKTKDQTFIIKPLLMLQVQDWIRNVPCAKMEGILKTEEIIQQAQIAVLKAWIGKYEKAKIKIFCNKFVLENNTSCLTR